MQERENIKERHGSDWEKMTPNEQDSAIDNGMMDPHIRARYAMHKVDREEVICYPKLLIQTGQKIVHFGDEVWTFTTFALVATYINFRELATFSCMIPAS